jgi:hypothetical protein
MGHEACGLLAMPRSAHWTRFTATADFRAHSYAEVSDTLLTTIRCPNPIPETLVFEVAAAFGESHQTNASVTQCGSFVPFFAATEVWPRDSSLNPTDTQGKRLCFRLFFFFGSAANQLKKTPKKYGLAFVSDCRICRRNSASKQSGSISIHRVLRGLEKPVRLRARAPTSCGGSRNRLPASRLRSTTRKGGACFITATRKMGLKRFRIRIQRMCLGMTEC